MVSGAEVSWYFIIQSEWCNWRVTLQRKREVTDSEGENTTPSTPSAEDLKKEKKKKRKEKVRHEEMEPECEEPAQGTDTEVSSKG